MSFEIHTGEVTSNKDPDKRGRLMVQFDSILDSQDFPEWIEPAFPFVGKDAGFFMIPSPGVWVDVEIHMGSQGDQGVDTPVARWRGAHYNSKDKLPDEFADNYPQAYGFKTPGGHFLAIDDKDKTLTIKTKGGHTLEFNDKAGTVKITNGNTGDDLAMSKTGTSTLEATLKAIISAPLTDLNSGAGLQFLVKGVTFNAALAVWVNLIKTTDTAVKNLVAKWDSLAQGSPGSPWIPSADASEVTALKTAVGLLETGHATFLAAMAGWLSLKTRTG